MSKSFKSKSYGDGVIAEVINKKITRRSFLKWSAALGATASATGLIAQSRIPKAYAEYGETAPNSISTVTDWVPSICLVCHGWCGIAVGLDADGTIRKIEGAGGQPKTGACTNWDANIREDFHFNKVGAVGGETIGEGLGGAGGNISLRMGTVSGVTNRLPTFPNNRGRICAKGNTGMEHTYDPDRVKYPLLRAGARGEGKWRRLTWCQALNGDPNIIIDGHPWPGAAKILRELGDAKAVDTMGFHRNPVTEVGKDLRHRFVYYVGRSELHPWQETFTGRYGTPNHVEHTSICEVSRHGAQIWRMKDKFPLVDHTTHHTIAGYFTGSGLQYTIDNDISSDDDTDFHIECGGNPTEVKIPHTSINRRLADRRRAGCRIVNIDVRMSNTGGFADEQINIVPGTDGALCAALFYEIGTLVGWATLKSDVDAGHLGAVNNTLTGREYVGLFIADEAADTGGAAKSLESYVKGLAVNDPDPVTKDANWAQAITCIPAADIKYLAECLCGSTASGQPEYHNATIDCYRGPTKHTNGHYNVALMRAVQTVAGKRTDDTAATLVRGGIDRPGGLMHNAWASHHNGDAGWNHRGDRHPVGNADGDTPQIPAKVDPAVKALYPSEAVGAGESDGGTQALWNWDYHEGCPKYVTVTHRVDQHLVPGIRASLGMHPYDVGRLATVDRKNLGGELKLPYGGWLGDPAQKGPALGGGFCGGTWAPPTGLYGYDPDFQVEVLMTSKNSPGNTRPNIQLDQELFTAKVTEQSPRQGEYRLRHYWAYDTQMGDGSRFADLILPSATYLEEYHVKTWENFALKWMKQLRQPVLSKNLYEAKTASQLFYHFARSIEPRTALSAAKAAVGAGVSTLSVHNACAFSVGDMVQLEIPDAVLAYPATAYTSVPFAVTAVNRAANTITVDTLAAGHPALPKDTRVFTNVAPWGGTLSLAWDWMAGGITSAGLPGDGIATGADTSAAAPEEPNMDGYGREIADEWLRHKVEAQGGNFPGAIVDARVDFIKKNGNFWVDADFANYYPRTDILGAVPVGVYNGAASMGKAEIYHSQIDKIADPSDPNLLEENDTLSLEGANTKCTFYGYPLYVPTRSQVDPTGRGSGGGRKGGPATSSQYPRHLTTYKVNVHTQSRTASVPRLTEIIGSCWAVMHPDPTSPDSKGEFAFDDTGTKVYSGDRVQIFTNENTAMSIFEVKVTRKAARIQCDSDVHEVVAISNSFGHEPTRPQVAGPLSWSPYQPEPHTTLTNPEGAAVGGGHSVYYVDGEMNRDKDANLYPLAPSATPGLKREGGVNDYRRAYPPTAPTRANHPNQAHARNFGPNTARIDGNEATDALGGSMAFYDTKCRVRKVT